MADPFDVLRLPVVPLSPRAEFAGDLRRRVARELDPTLERAGERATVSAYLCVSGALAAIDFYKAVFGAVEEFPPLVGPDGRVGHCELRIGESTFAIADEYPEEGARSPLLMGGTSVQLRLQVPDADAVFDRAVAAGAEVLRPVAVQPYGERAGKIRDPFGHNWFITTVVEQLSVADVAMRFEDQGYELRTTGTPGGEPAEPSGTSGHEPHEPHEPHEHAAPLGPHDAGQIFYFTFGVADGDRARRFFGRLFDWEIQPGSMPGGYHVANLTPPGGLHGGEPEPRLSLYFRVDDIQAAVARVRELGGQADEPVLYASGWSASCRDDQGLEFHLSEAAPGY